MSCNVLSPSITIIIQAETLFELEERTEDKNLKYVFQTYLLTLAKFALGICCDNKLAHVVLVTSSKCNPRDFEKSMKHLSLFSLPIWAYPPKKELALGGKTEAFILQAPSEQEVEGYLSKYLKEDRKHLASHTEIVKAVGSSYAKLERFVNFLNHYELSGKNLTLQPSYHPFSFFKKQCGQVWRSNWKGCCVNLRRRRIPRQCNKKIILCFSLELFGIILIC